MQAPAWFRRVPPYVWAVPPIVLLLFALGLERPLDRLFTSIPAFGALCLLAAYLINRRERRRTANQPPPAAPPPRPYDRITGGTLTRKKDGTTFWKRPR